MAAFSPFVALLGEHGADQADQRVAVGKDADHVGAPADLAVEPLAGVVGPDLPPDLFGKGGEGEHVGASGLHVLGRLSAACRPARRAPGRTSAAAANVCLVGGGVEVPRGVETASLVSSDPDFPAGDARWSTPCRSGRSATTRACGCCASCAAAPGRW